MRVFLIGEGLWEVTDTLLSTLNQNSDTQLDAKAQYHLICCIDMDDKELTADLNTARDIYAALWKKYSKKLKTTGRQYVEEWATYKKSPSKSIEETWTEVSTMARKVKENYPGFEAVASIPSRIQSLLKCLPDNVYEHI